MKRSDIINLLPENYKQLCWESKAMSRHRGIQDEETLLLLALFYSYGNSLIDVKNYAKLEFGINISDVGFMKRFSRCNEWITSILSEMMNNEVIHYHVPDKLSGYKVVAIDGSDISERGAVHRLYHLHYAVNLFTLSSEQFIITSQTQGETLKNFNLGSKTIVIGDRAYATLSGIEYCLGNQTDFVLRIRNNPFKLFDKNGTEVLISSLLRNISEKSSDFILYYKCDNQLKPLRFCAVKKTADEIAVEEKRLKRIESKHQTNFSDDTKFTHKYFFVVTSLDESFTSDEILRLYKLRWQVEMVFKRYKSILNLGSIPTKTDVSGKVWLNCKMLVALLIEKLMSKVDFSPTECVSKLVEGDESLLPVDTDMFFYSR